MAAADKPERHGAIKCAGPGQRGNRTSARVGQVGWAMPSSGGAPVPIRAVLGLEENVHARGQVVCDQRRNSDAEIDQHARFELASNSARNDRSAVPFGHSRIGDEVIDDGCRRHHMVGRDHADRNDVVGAGDDGVGGHRDDRIEIAGCQRIAQIAEIVGQESLHEREVGAERGFKQIALSIDFDALLAVLDRRSDAGLRQDAAQAMIRRRGSVRSACLVERGPPPVRLPSSASGFQD